MCPYVGFCVCVCRCVIVGQQVDECSRESRVSVDRQWNVSDLCLHVHTNTHTHTHTHTHTRYRVHLLLLGWDGTAGRSEER